MIVGRQYLSQAEQLSRGGGVCRCRHPHLTPNDVGSSPSAGTRLNDANKGTFRLFDGGRRLVRRNPFLGQNREAQYHRNRAHDAHDSDEAAYQSHVDVSTRIGVCPTYATWHLAVGRFGCSRSSAWSVSECRSRFNSKTVLPGSARLLEALGVAAGVQDVVTSQLASGTTWIVGAEEGCDPRHEGRGNHYPMLSQRCRGTRCLIRPPSR
jgi:hypothetical protein